MMPFAVRSETRPARICRRRWPDHRHRFENAGQQRQEHGVLDAENNAETDISGDGGVDHDANARR